MNENKLGLLAVGLCTRKSVELFRINGYIAGALQPTRRYLAYSVGYVRGPLKRSIMREPGEAGDFCLSMT